MRNRAQAQSYVENHLNKEKADYIVAYQNVFGQLQFLACSTGLATTVKAPPNTPLRKFVRFGKDQITIGQKTLAVDIAVHPWGLVIFVESESIEDHIETLGDRLTRINGSVKKIIAAITSLGLLLGSAIVALRDFIPAPFFSATKPAKSSDDSGLAELIEILDDGETHLANNGNYYWRYYDCKKRRLVAGSSNYRENPLDVIEVRFTSDDVWDEIFAAHQQRQPYTVFRQDLPDNNALSIVMDKLGVGAVVTVPLNRFADNCPIGYVSTGLFKSPSPEQEQEVIQLLQGLGDRIEDWEREYGN